MTVVVTRRLPPPGIEPLLAAGLPVTYLDGDGPPTREDLLGALGTARGLLTLLTDRVDAELMDAAPHLQVVANLAVGYDNVDLAATSARGVVVTNTPGVLTEATADLTWALALAAARRLVEGDAWVRSGRWPGWGPDQLLGRPVAGRTLGIVGMGAIGSAVARRAAGFAMPVLYHNRRPRPDEATLGATYVPFEELVDRAEILTLHAPLTDATHHLVDAAVLSAMPDHAVLVNTARGALVDETALTEALQAGTIAAAGLDVFEDEPRLTPGLADLPNVVLAPHAGSATTAARSAMVQLCCDNIVAVLSGRPALTPVTGTRTAAGPEGLSR